MKRIAPLAGVLVLGALLRAPGLHGAAPPNPAPPINGALIGSGLGAIAGALVAPPPTCSDWQTPAACGPAGAACPLAAPPSVSPARVNRAGVVEELIALLDETQSRDTFLTTVVILRSLGSEARPALPAALRNAERLGLLHGVCKHGWAGKGGPASVAVLQALVGIAQAQPATYPAAPPPVYPPAPAYGYTPPATYPVPPTVYTPANPPPAYLNGPVGR